MLVAVFRGTGLPVPFVPGAGFSVVPTLGMSQISASVPILTVSLVSDVRNASWIAATWSCFGAPFNTTRHVVIFEPGPIPPPAMAAGSATVRDANAARAAVRYIFLFMSCLLVIDDSGCRRRYFTTMMKSLARIPVVGQPGARQLVLR